MDDVMDERDGEVVEDDGLCSLLDAMLLFDEFTPLPLVALAEED